MAVGSILSQIAKLVARQKTTKGLIKNAVKNKLPHTKLKAKEKMLDKSIKRLETKAAAAKTTSKDGQRLATEISNKKRKTPDSAKALQFSDPKDAQMQVVIKKW
jgi:gas vesicle protein